MLAEHELTRKDLQCQDAEEVWLRLMPRTTLRYSINDVKKAGDALISPNASAEDREWAREVFTNWRDCHTYPLSVFYKALYKCSKSIWGAAITVSRMKREEAVIAKLDREANMKLSMMQDIAGCRAILPTPDVYAVVEAFRKQQNKHELYRPERGDYIANPPPSGYRGVHLVYRYKSARQAYARRFVEVQIRSWWQHTWATALETVDVFTGQNLKAGQGDKNWLRFFALMGTAIANMERMPPVPGMPTGKELRDELRDYAARLDVESRIRAYGSTTLQSKSLRNASHFLIELKLHAHVFRITGFRSDEIENALETYSITEKANPNTVLIEASSVKNLRDAYPNYTLDTQGFLRLLSHALSIEYW
jgi:hypothetical protein